MKFHSEHRLFLMSIAVVALTGILLIFGIYYINLGRKYEDWVRHSYEVQSAVAEVQSLTRESESSVRGYLLTGQKHFLSPYERTRNKLPDALHTLNQLVQDNRDQADASVQILTAVDRRIELLEKSLAEFKLHGNVENSELSARLEMGRLEMDKISLLSQNMSAKENLLLEHRKEAADEAALRAQIYGSLILVTILLLVVGLYLSLHRASTQRQQAESLRKSEERFRTIADKMPSILWQLDSRGNPIFINRMWFDFTGSTEEEYAHDCGRSYLHPDDRERIFSSLGESVREGKPWKMEFRIRSRQGAYGWFQATGVPLHRPDGTVECFVGKSMNITDLHNVHEALKAEQQRLAVTLHSIGDGVVTTDTEGQVALLNREGEYLTGWSQSEAAGRPLAEVFHIIHEFTRLPIENPVKKVLRTGRTVELANHTVLVSRDGKERIIADSAAPIRDADGQIIGTVLVFRDSTQKEKLAEEMMRSSKLESLGVLAGGIAHDFNNLLGTILGNISLIERFPEDVEGNHTCLQESRRACLRAKELTQQLLTFAKGGVPVKKLANLENVLTESTRFALHGSSAQLALEIASDLHSVMMDSGQISQVVHNIVLNAAQAMPGGGLVRVRAINESNHPMGKMVRISISDTGPGIKPEHQIKIFDPYFTTKANGTGLGLASAYSIIKKHEGDILVESALGHGTTFHVLLPAHDEKTSEALTSPVADRLIGGQGRLLVLEDDRMLARMLKLMLTNLGYDAVVAYTGTQTIDFYREAMTSGQPFQGCLLDLTIAGSISGAETLEHLRGIDPKVRALVCSGYSNDQIVANFKQHGFCGIVAKPYAIEDIAQAVNAMLTMTIA